MAPRIGLVAGESSGDLLGAALIPALRQRWPNAHFAGIGGTHMQAEGFRSLYPLERLSVMGLVEPLQRLPELLAIRRGLYRHFTRQGFDLVMGIDAPDFNLGLERRLRRAGLRTAHYVSPSVWAWRQGRVRSIRRAVDLMLTLFPFEEGFYRSHGVPVCCVGHPLADALPLQPDPDRASARRQLGLPVDAPVVALLPGSRGGEVGQMARPFLATAQWLLRRRPGLHFVLPAATPERRRQVEAALAHCDSLPLTLLDGQSRLAMAAADVVLMASGTTTLEAMLLKKPMVVAYRMAPWSWRLLSPLVKVPWVALPNLLARRELVPERLQDAVTPEVLGPLLLAWLDNPERQAALVESFTGMHEELRRGASRRAAEALETLLEAKRHA